MIALALDCGAVRLRQDGPNLVRVQITQFPLGSALHRDTEHFRALGGHQRFLTHNEPEEAVEGSEPAVPRSDRHFAFLFAVLQKDQHLGRTQIRETEPSDWLIFSGGDVPEKQAPSIPIRNHREMRSVPLFDQPVMEKTVQQLGKQALLHLMPPIGAPTAKAPYRWNRSLACCSNSWVIVR